METKTRSEEYLTTEQAARRLSVSIITIRELIRRGELRANRINRRYRISESDLQDYLQRSRVNA